MTSEEELIKLNQIQIEYNKAIISGQYSLIISLGQDWYKQSKKLNNTIFQEICMKYNIDYLDKNIASVELGSIIYLRSN